MFRSTTSKVALIVLLALAVGYYDLPNQYQTIPGTPASLADDHVNLGLDLQGGSQLDYKIDLRKVPEEDRAQIVEGVREVVNKRVNTLGVSEPIIYTSNIADEQHLIVELAGIKDLDKAKEVVGKTIQLEFKEEREGEDPQYVEKVRSQAETTLNKIKEAPGSFDLLAQEEEQSAQDKIKYSEEEWAFTTSLTGDIGSALKGLKEGEVTQQLIQTSNGYIFNNGALEEQKGFFILQLDEIRSTSALPADEKEVLVRHVLIAYSGAESAEATVTRTKEEAQARATEIYTQLQSGATTVEQRARDESDEGGADGTGGLLTRPVKQGGAYDDAFTQAALKLTEENRISPIVETPFGFHIIEAVDFNQVKYSQLFYSEAPDPWQSTELTGEHFKKAEVVFDNLLQPVVNITFDEEGAELFEEITGRNVQKPIAIFVGGNLISAPTVQGKIAGGNAIINGMPSVQVAQDLARDLNTGAIPAPILLTSQYTIGATLGEEALSTSVRAGILGLILLAIFMVIYYRLPGVIAVVALSIYTALLIFLIKASLPLWFALIVSLGIFVVIVYKILQSRDGGWEKFLTFILACFILFFLTFLIQNPVVLTLAGVAGVILSIGMAVDANILIFERIKEELRGGRPLSSAIDVGFDRAWSSIRDSNFSSLLTCAILFYFGTSIIQGFAFNLAAGILVSMFSAITITKTLLQAFMKTKFGANLALWGVPQKAERKPYKIVENSQLWFSISGVLVAISVIAALTIGLKFSIDFTGGTLMDVTFENEVSVEQIQAELAALEPQVNADATPSASTAPTEGDMTTLSSGTKPVELANSRVVTAGERQFLINMPHITNEAHDLILATFNEKFGTATENRFTTIGPVVGETLKRKAVIAVLVAIIMIILYIAFAFRKVPKKVSPWKFGTCAIIALIHDVLIPVGIFALFNLEVDALFITALLTVLGFSVHDTIVVFDRIRENLKFQTRDESFTEVANKSLTQTMARSINTSMTTLVTLLALLILGSPSIFNFILVLVVGIFAGTYSSIFLATTVLARWQESSSKQ
ncbi:protein translocase subunit SecF [Candidatus Peregrinibacteria bacterium CG_4_9_14_0_2_um_filter_53_11]|nr:MAG: protein translocase subunit SecF [Candidatus Peregrinibacteria bacterium CG_4_9_14_0_2_um_filter_53_11]